MSKLGIVASLLYLSGCAFDSTPACGFERGRYELTVAGNTPEIVEFTGSYKYGCKGTERNFIDFDTCNYVLYLQCPDANILYELREVANGYWIGTATSGDTEERATLQLL